VVGCRDQETAFISGGSVRRMATSFFWSSESKERKSNNSAEGPVRSKELPPRTERVMVSLGSATSVHVAREGGHLADSLLVHTTVTCGQAVTAVTMRGRARALWSKSRRRERRRRYCQRKGGMSGCIGCTCCLSCPDGTVVADAGQFNAAVLGNDASAGWDRIVDMLYQTPPCISFEGRTPLALI